MWRVATFILWMLFCATLVFGFVVWFAEAWYPTRQAHEILDAVTLTSILLAALIVVCARRA